MPLTLRWMVYGMIFTFTMPTIPLLLLTICVISLAYIGIRAKNQLKRDAKQVIGKMYATLKDKTPDFSEEVWNRYLENEGISVKVAEKL